MPIPVDEMRVLRVSAFDVLGIETGFVSRSAEVELEMWSGCSSSSSSDAVSASYS